MAIRMRYIIWISAVVLLAGALVTLLIAYRSDLRRGVRNLDSLSSHVFHSSFGDVEYLLEGSGPTVLVSHGITGGVDQGAGLARTYLGPGYRLLLVSRFGYLKSSLPQGASAELQARAYLELLDSLGIERTFLFGNSAGGTSVLHFAIEFPQRCSGLILLSSNVPGATPALPPKPAMAAVFGSSFVYWASAKLAEGTMLQMFVLKAVLSELSPAALADIKGGILLAGLPIARRTRGVVFDMYVSNPSIERPLPFTSIASPTLIIHAEDDPSCIAAGARLLAASIPGSRLQMFAKGGHLILGHEEEIRSLIRKFIIGS